MSDEQELLEQRADKFWSRVNKDGTIPAYRPELGVCWIWTGTMDAGYGTMSINSKDYRAHVLAVRLTGRLIPKGMNIDHLCRNTACVNPNHLEVVPIRINTLRGFSPIAQNVKKTHCPKGHPLAGQNLDLRYRPNGIIWRRCKLCERCRWAIRTLVRRQQAAAKKAGVENGR